MALTQNLTGSEAVDKLKSLVNGKAGLFTTFDGEHELDARPMFSMGVDDDGTMWYFSKAGSNKNRQLAANPRVNISYIHAGSDSYLFIHGTATVSRDQATIDRLWTDFAKAWFEEGKNDPTLTLIKVDVKDAQYWDTQHGKLISTAKILLSALTGAKMDGGRHGDLVI